LTLRQTLALVRSDYRRLSRTMSIPISFPRVLFVACMPSIMALTLFRLSHWLYVKRVRSLAWMTWMFNTYLTGADIAPYSSIGASCYIGHALGCRIGARIGDNATIFGTVGIGGGRGRGDVGAGEGLPVIGDDVVIGDGARVLGPIRVGDRAMIGAMTLVLKDVPADMVVVGIPARVLKPRSASIDYEALERGREPRQSRRDPQT